MVALIPLSCSFNRVRTDRNVALDSAIQEQAINLATSLFQMLHPDHLERPQGSRSGVAIAVNEVRPWNWFATTSVPPLVIEKGVYATTSLEGWHNRIHNMCGDGGHHIGAPTFAGFDPIFWMLHNNIDRLLALYQAMYPDKWLTPDESGRELRPFRKEASGVCFKSDDEFVKGYWGPGFAVPGDEKLDATRVKDDVKKYITKTYYW